MQSYLLIHVDAETFGQVILYKKHLLVNHIAEAFEPSSTTPTECIKEYVNQIKSSFSRLKEVVIFSKICSEIRIFMTICM